MSTSINPISTGITPATTATPGTTTSANPTGSGLTQTANMNTFLTLLVAQLKNQDPLQPTDGTQFVSQLAEFSSLEQEIGINTNTQSTAQELQQLIASQSTPTTGTTGSSVTNNSTSGTTNQ